MGEPENAKIKLIRTSNWVYRLRRFGVFVDSIKVGSIANEEEFDFIVAPGRHALVLKVSWCKSETLTLDVTAGDRIELECGTRLKFWMFGALAIFVVVGNVLMKIWPLAGGACYLLGFIHALKLMLDTFKPGTFLYLCTPVSSEPTKSRESV